jgi:hypothetical protein
MAGTLKEEDMLHGVAGRPSASAMGHSRHTPLRIMMVTTSLIVVTAGALLLWRIDSKREPGRVGVYSGSASLPAGWIDHAYGMLTFGAPESWKISSDNPCSLGAYSIGEQTLNDPAAGDNPVGVGLFNCPAIEGVQPTTWAYVECTTAPLISIGASTVETAGPSLKLNRQQRSVLVYGEGSAEIVEVGASDSVVTNRGEGSVPSCQR